MLPKRNIYNRKYTKEDFVERANIVHKNKFTYPGEYINSITKIEICCPVHGIFTQVPASHLLGIGCPACSGNKRHTTEELIKDAKEVYGDLYILDKIKYTNSMMPFEVICRKHGSFFKTRAEFIGNKSGCNKCSRQTLDTDLFKELAYEKHGEKYNYDKTIYVKSNQKVIMTCPEHGDFTMRPNNHLTGQGCPSCGGKDEISLDDLQKRNYHKYGDRFKILTTDYINSDNKLTFYCNKHKTTFESSIYNHLKHYGCKQCFKEHIDNNTAENVHSFIARAKEVHYNKYDYSMVNYKGNKIPVNIICPKHGNFYQRPDMHLHNTTGCPVCNSSKGELKIYHFLKNKKIKFIKEYKLKNYAYRYDFYLPDYNLFIEYHGEQHYKVVTAWGGEEGLKKRMKHDKIKRNLVKKVLQKEILEIPYTKFNKIIDILKKKLNII